MTNHQIPDEQEYHQPIPQQPPFPQGYGTTNPAVLPAILLFLGTLFIFFKLVIQAGVNYDWEDVEYDAYYNWYGSASILGGIGWLLLVLGFLLGLKTAWRRQGMLSPQTARSMNIAGIVISAIIATGFFVQGVGYFVLKNEFDTGRNIVGIAQIIVGIGFLLMSISLFSWAQAKAKYTMQEKTVYRLVSVLIITAGILLLISGIVSAIINFSHDLDDPAIWRGIEYLLGAIGFTFLFVGVGISIKSSHIHSIPRPDYPPGSVRPDVISFAILILAAILTGIGYLTASINWFRSHNKTFDYGDMYEMVDWYDNWHNWLGTADLLIWKSSTHRTPFHLTNEGSTHRTLSCL